MDAILEPPKCPRCGAPLQLAGIGPDFMPCASCSTLTPPTLAELVLLAVGAADKGEEVPPWREAAKWAAVLKGGGDGALAFVRWLDFELGIVMAHFGPDSCDRCDPADDVEPCGIDHPPVGLPVEAPVELLLAQMHGVDLEEAERQRRELAQWWRGKQPPRTPR